MVVVAFFLIFVLKFIKWQPHKIGKFNAQEVSE